MSVKEIELYSRDMRRVIAFAIKTYRMTFPKDTLIEEIEHEVAISLFKSKVKIGASIIIKQLMWTRAEIWKNASRKGNYTLINDIPVSECTDDGMDARSIISKIAKIPKLSSQERDLLNHLSQGLDTRQICAKMKINSRQRFEQIKKVAFFKVRTLCPEAEYWGTNEQAIPRAT